MFAQPASTTLRQRAAKADELEASITDLKERIVSLTEQRAFLLRVIDLTRPTSVLGLTDDAASMLDGITRSAASASLNFDRPKNS